jgi:predicted ABC-type ATPase
LPIVDKWSIYDNSDYTSGHPEIVAEQFPKETVIIENVEVWDILNNISNTKK